MKKDPHLNRVFEEGVQVSFNRNKNLRDLICRSRLYPIQSRPTRSINGWRTCLKRCVACTYSHNVKQLKCSATGQTFQIEQQISCDDCNVIYMIQCKRCNVQYVGKTSSKLKTRINRHRNSIGQSATEVARHFEIPGHGVENFLAFAIKKVLGDIFVLGVRERHWIDTLDVISTGLNLNQTNI